MFTNDKPSWFSRFVTSHFNKRVFPYWFVILADTVIVFISTAFVYWAFHRTSVTYEHRFSLLYTMLLYSALSWIGAKAFRTYSGVVRYSGFVDLLKVVYANALTCLLAVALRDQPFQQAGIPLLVRRAGRYGHRVRLHGVRLLGIPSDRCDV